MPKNKVKKGVKYCPQCGAALKEKDKFCIKCNYSFEGRKKKIKLKNLIIIIGAIIILWIVIRIVTNQPLIPQPITNIFTNKTAG